MNEKLEKNVGGDVFEVLPDGRVAIRDEDLAEFVKQRISSQPSGRWSAEIKVKT